MRVKIAIGFALVAVAALSAMAPVEARPRIVRSAPDPVTSSPEWVIASRVRGITQLPGQIACTPVGCMPVPPGCFGTPLLSFSNTQIDGYDRIVCPAH